MLKIETMVRSLHQKIIHQRAKRVECGSFLVSLNSDPLMVLMEERADCFP